PSRRARQASGRRAVHGRRGGEFCLRETRSGRRHERQSRTPARVLRSCNGQRATCNKGLGAGTSAGTERRQTRLEVQSGHHGAGGADLCGAAAKMRAMSGETGLPDWKGSFLMRTRWLPLGLLVALSVPACKRDAPRAAPDEPPAVSPAPATSTTVDTVDAGWQTPEAARVSGVQYTAPTKVFGVLGVTSDNY